MNGQQLRNTIRNQIEGKKQERQEAVKLHNKKYNKYYQSSGWKALRLWKITTSPLCENCLHYDIVTPADEVHHKIPWLTGKTEADRWRLLLDASNTMSLCSSCHKLYHRYMRQNNTNIVDGYIEPDIEKALTI